MNRSIERWVTTGLLLSSLLTATEIGAENSADVLEERSSSDFIRFVENDAGAQLQSSIVTYRREDGAAVHLVAALHIGEKSYYERLSEVFEGYDALLYELIGGEQLPAPGTPSNNVLSMFQRWLKNALKLEFQLDAIDYRRDNFVHADLDVETFLKLQRERGESVFTLMIQAMILDLKRRQDHKKAPELNIFSLLRVLLKKDKATEMKLLLGRQFHDIEETLAGLGGKDGSVILTERNKIAIRVLEETLGAGRKNIGIFYGAAHMPDLEERLVRDLGFKRVDSHWQVAWDIPKPKREEGAPAATRTPKTARF